MTLQRSKAIEEFEVNVALHVKEEVLANVARKAMLD